MHQILLICLAGGALFAASGENVLLVVNRSSEVSLRIGHYYAAKRSVPAGNICSLWTTTDEEITRDVYDREIAAPIAAFLKMHKLEEKILYIVTTLGLPLKIAGSGRKDSDAAAVDSELTLLYREMGGWKNPLRGPVLNPFYRKRDEPFRHPEIPIYLVTRLAAYDFEDVKAMIDRSLAAQNRGNFVLDLSSGGDEDGDNWLRTAAILLPAGRVVLEETRRVLYGQKQVIGYGSWGSNDSARDRRWLGFQWLPGAIVTEYVSTDGRTFQRPPDDWKFTNWKDEEHFFAGSPQGLAADYIHEGATGASGHVYEPFLQATPRPDFLFPAYYKGRNLAESFYLAIPALSWMNIVVGDPLCAIGNPR